MIQRKQTVFLLLAAIIGLVCLILPIGSFIPEKLGAGYTMFNLWVIDGNGGVTFGVAPLFGILFAEVILSLITVFLYNNRKLQIKLCSVNIFLLVLWYAAYVALAMINKDTYGAAFKVEYSAVFPLVSLILIVMARNGVKADEALVRAADRIR